MLACYSHHRKRVGIVAVDCASSLAGPSQGRTVGNRTALQKARRQEQLALYAEARLKKFPPTGGNSAYLLTGATCHDGRRKRTSHLKSYYSRKKEYILLQSYRYPHMPMACPCDCLSADMVRSFFLAHSCLRSPCNTALDFSFWMVLQKLALSLPRFR